MDKAKFSFIMNAMRRASYKWPGRYIAAKRTHVGRNQYICEGCGGTFKKKETQMDHIESVVPVEGSDDLNVLLDRMLVNEEGWQRLCSVGDEGGCHGKKTKAENAKRREIKNAKAGVKLEEEVLVEVNRTKKKTRKK